MLGDHVASDAVEPPDRRAAVGPVAADRLEQLDEHRSDRVGDRLGVAEPARGEPDDLVHVPVVELDEGGLVQPQADQQLLVRPIAQAGSLLTPPTIVPLGDDLPVTARPLHWALQSAVAGAGQDEHADDRSTEEGTSMVVGFQVSFDAADPQRLAAFWQEALGYQLQDPPEGYATWEDWARAVGIPEEAWDNTTALVDPDGVMPRLFFQRVPEPKTAKNRVHLDLSVSGGREVPQQDRRPRVDAAADRLVGLGATLVRPNDEPDQYWVVMRDPEGNEFCLQ